MKKPLVAIIIVSLLSAACAHREPWTKVDTYLAIASTAATLADIYTTERMLDNPRNYETNPILGEHPSDAEVIAVLSIAQSMILAAAYLLPKKKYRRILLLLKTALNLYGTGSNLTLEW